VLTSRGRCDLVGGIYIDLQLRREEGVSIKHYSLAESWLVRTNGPGRNPILPKKPVTKRKGEGPRSF